jgi:hypothetical protein
MVSFCAILAGCNDSKSSVDPHEQPTVQSPSIAEAEARALLLQECPSLGRFGSALIATGFNGIDGAWTFEIRYGSGDFAIFEVFEKTGAVSGNLRALYILDTLC